MASLLLLLLLLGPPMATANVKGTGSPRGGLACDSTFTSGIDDAGSPFDLAGDSASVRGRHKSTHTLGLGSDSAAGRGKGNPLRIGTQNTQGLSEEKLSWLVERDFDVLALTENHSDLADSRLAAELGSSIVSCGPVDKDKKSATYDPAAGVALLLSPRCACAVIDKGHVGARICWIRLDALFKPLFIASVYWPHSKRENAPYREDTAAELQQLLSDKVEKGDVVMLMGDFNSRLAKNDGRRSGSFSPHSRADDGGALMLETMEEHDLLAANTFFQPSRQAARNTGSATYCMSKEYIQKKHTRYQCTQPPAILDYVLAPARFKSSLKSARVTWNFSRAFRGVILVVTSTEVL
jgi:exonuclease III